MKVKAVDIAKKLGISKATVSLALNGKPGVSQETRDAVMQCYRQLESGGGFTDSDQSELINLTQASPVIKIIVIDKKLGIVCDSTFSLWMEILRVFDSEAKKRGYNIGVTYIGSNEAETEAVVQECNRPPIAGVVLYATELTDSDMLQKLALIQKPMVSFDYDMGDLCSSVVIDNEDGVEKAVDYLASRGCKTIEYLSQTIDIYNFERRRAGFLNGVYKNKLDMSRCPIIPVASTIADAEAYLTEWLSDHPLPDAFLMENYQLSVGMLRALQKLNIKVPEQVSLLGVDDITTIIINDGMELACVNIPHQNRAGIVMDILFDEIKEKKKIKFKTAVKGRVIAGSTVR